MITLVFFLEEPSARAMLEGLLPGLVSDSVNTRFIVFEGKQDLEKQLEHRIRGWRSPDSKFVIIRDQDSGDCHTIKARLVEKCAAAGHPDALVRIACRELESWYLGDLSAVAKAFGLPAIERRASEAKFRDPDRLNNPAQELISLTQGRYQKIAGSRALGPLLNANANVSPSFKVLLAGLRRLIPAS